MKEAENMTRNFVSVLLITVIFLASGINARELNQIEKERQMNFISNLGAFVVPVAGGVVGLAVGATGGYYYFGGGKKVDSVTFVGIVVGSTIGFGVTKLWRDSSHKKSLSCAGMASLPIAAVLCYLIMGD